MHKSFINRLSDFFVNYFSFSGQLVSQQEAEAAIRDGVSFKGTNIVILVLAILIASLGLNTNSTAVIIGAMLISPLMGPIIGIGLGVGIHDFDLIRRSLRNLVMAAGFSVLASTLFFLISPVNEQHSELLARTSPTIYDVLIGFVGGGAAPEVAPEIKAVFPRIREMGVTTTVFARPGDGRNDTVTVAMINVEGRMPGVERKRLAAFLEARLGKQDVKVVEVPSF